MIRAVCPGCGVETNVGGDLAGTSIECRVCGAKFPLPTLEPPPAPPKSKGPLVILLIVAGVCVGGCVIVAIVAALVMPAFVRAKAKAGEVHSLSSLKSIVTAQENFRANDLDRNYVMDYWTANVAGLYCLKLRDPGMAIAALNDIGVASADLGRGGVTYGNESVVYDESYLVTPGPRNGYYYQALRNGPDGQPYAQDTDGSGEALRNVSQFGVAAIPADYGSPHSHVFIAGEASIVYRRDFGSATVRPRAGVPIKTFDGVTPVDFPADPSAWSKVE